jgi:hypothetical protein
MTLSNSIVANNTASFAANCFLESPPPTNTIVNGGGNLFYPHDAYDQCPGLFADPKLGSLANNGGTTQTMALGDGSGAIDIGVLNHCLPKDQRGVTRPQGIACDAGAYEKVQPPPTNTQTSTTPTQTTPTQTTPTQSTPTPDKTPPVVKLLLRKQRLRGALKKGYVAAFSTNEAGKARATLFARSSDLRAKSVQVASGKLTIAAPGKFKVRLKFTKKAKKALTRLHRVKLRLRLVVTDVAGNVTTKTASVTLKR